jgi:hypothetical protein
MKTFKIYLLTRNLIYFDGLFSNACNYRAAKTVDRLRKTTTVHLVIADNEITPFWAPLLIQQK